MVHIDPQGQGAGEDIPRLALHGVEECNRIQRAWSGRTKGIISIPDMTEMIIKLLDNHFGHMHNIT